jgi:hypothetical protein
VAKRGNKAFEPEPRFNPTGLRNEFQASDNGIFCLFFEATGRSVAESAPQQEFSPSI